MARAELTAERLRQLLSYDKEAGVFKWRIKPAKKIRIGDFAGWQAGKGYIGLTLDGSKYKAHRVAWLYCYGAWPNIQIDHINRNRGDNRIANLREVTPAQNQQNTGPKKNSTSEFKGVSLQSSTGKWVAQIRINGKSTYLGLFELPEQAAAAYSKAAAKYHTHNPMAKYAAMARELKNRG